MVPQLPYWCALAVALSIYWNLPPRFRARFLALASAVMAVYLARWQGVLYLAWVVVFYKLVPRPGARAETARLVLSSLVLAILGYLALFKYLPPLLAAVRGGSMEDVVIPAGISYLTFKLIHYAVETRRGNIPAHTFADFAEYLLLFPTFTAGPIERFDHFLANRVPIWRNAYLVDGLTRIIHGLIKRFALVEVVLPKLLGTLPETRDFVANLEHTSAAYAWWFVSLRYIYAYLDFSAYADIAIGSSRLFGIGIMENFNWPILATNINDFWRRWHMTLAGWCTAYVYMPLIGLTRNPYLAALGSFLTIGAWHAASWQWILWGAYNAAGVIAFVAWNRSALRRRYRGREPRWYPLVGWAATFLFVAAGQSFTVTHNEGTIYDSLRIVAKLVGVELGA